MTRKYVLDASVAVKWFSSADEKDLKKSLRLRQAHIDNSIALAIPDLLYYELANALRYNPAFTPKDVDAAMESIFNLGIETREANPQLIRNAIVLAYKTGVTIYDACFLSLAQELDAILITADQSFLRKVSSLNFVQRLSDFDL